MRQRVEYQHRVEQASLTKDELEGWDRGLLCHDVFVFDSSKIVKQKKESEMVVGGQGLNGLAQEAMSGRLEMLK